MIAVLDGVVLLSPGFLALGILVPVVWIIRARATRAAVNLPPGEVAAASAPPLPRGIRARLRPTLPLIEAAGLLLLVVALARPARLVPIPAEREGIDVALVLDTSSSMTAKDLDPERTRLMVALDAAAEFVAARPDDRIGLLTFARYPDLRSPVTLDHGALLEHLAAVRPVEADGPEDATGIGTAVARAVDLLAGGDAKSKVVVLLTDGEENVAVEGAAGEIAPLHAGQLARDLGVRVYAISVGAGAAAEAIDLAPVRTMAARTGGRLFTARDAAALAEVYREIDRLERAEFSEQEYEIEEAFPPFLAAALALLLAGRALRATGFQVLP